MNTLSEQEAEVSDVELLRRAVTYSRPCGFEVVEKWRTVASLFSVSEAAAQSLCQRFGVDPYERVAR
jgi:hypothetical protein